MTETILYLEPVSGISGDMLLGAFLDLGVPVEVLNEAWSALGISNYEIEIFETQKSGMRALQCRVRTEEQKGPRSWKEYQKVLNSSQLPAGMRKNALALCRRLLELEARIHGTTLARAHLHEIGGSDLMIDVIGTLASVEYLKPSRILSSAVNIGRGFVSFSHGKLPVPAPATAALLEGVPVFQNEVEGELTTPTGALLLTHIVQGYGPIPTMTLLKTAAGAGEREIPGRPNILRMMLGSVAAQDSEEDIWLAETNIDDSNPQILAYFMEKAFEKSALDVFFTPVFMKKNRPGVRLSILATRDSLQEIIDLLFAETTAIGLRYWKVERQRLDRRWKDVKLGRWNVRIKESYREGKLYNYQPEYEDCRAVAEKTGKPVKEIIAEAIHRYLSS